MFWLAVWPASFWWEEEPAAPAKCLLDLEEVSDWVQRGRERQWIWRTCCRHRRRNECVKPVYIYRIYFSAANFWFATLSVTSVGMINFSARIRLIVCITIDLKLLWKREPKIERVPSVPPHLLVYQGRVTQQTNLEEKIPCSDENNGNCEIPMQTWNNPFLIPENSIICDRNWKPCCWNSLAGFWLFTSAFRLDILVYCQCLWWSQCRGLPVHQGTLYDVWHAKYHYWIYCSITPQQNSMVEWKFLTNRDKSIAATLKAKFSDESQGLLWAESINTQTYLTNSVLNTNNMQKNPDWIFLGKCPEIYGHLIEFGHGWLKTPGKVPKLEAKASYYW